MRARYYDPLTATFISKDPVEGSLKLPLSQNGYSFVHGNPVNLSDPSGEFVITTPIAGACIIGAYAAYNYVTSPVVQNSISSLVSGAASTISTLFANETKSGKITGYTKHGEEQAQGRDGGKGVVQGAIDDAVAKPREVVKQPGGTIKYIGENATVILNGAGQVVTTWANNSSGVRNP